MPKARSMATGKAGITVLLFVVAFASITVGFGYRMTGLPTFAAVQNPTCDQTGWITLSIPPYHAGDLQINSCRYLGTDGALHNAGNVNGQTSSGQTYGCGGDGFGACSNPTGFGVPSGTIVTVTATPSSGWVFDHWEIKSSTGTTTASSATYQMPMPNDAVTLNAYYYYPSMQTTSAGGGVSTTFQTTVVTSQSTSSIYSQISFITLGSTSVSSNTQTSVTASQVSTVIVPPSGSGPLFMGLYAVQFVLIGFGAIVLIVAVLYLAGRRR